MSDWPLVYGIRIEPGKCKAQCPNWRRINEESLVEKLWEEFKDQPGDYYTPHSILRLLVERDGDEQLTREAMQGRSEVFNKMGIPEIRKQWVGRTWGQLMHGDRLSTMFPVVGKVAMGKNGNGIFYANVGGLTPAQVSEIADMPDRAFEEWKQQFLLWAVHMNFMTMADNNREMSRRGKLVGFSMVLDFKDTAYWGIFRNKDSYSKLLKPFLDIANKYFDPGYRFYCVNTPMMFKALWTVFKLMLRKSTRNKYVIASGIPDSLIEAAGVENLPKVLGGNCPDPPFKQPLPPDWRGCRYYRPDAEETD